MAAETDLEPVDAKRFQSDRRFGPCGKRCYVSQKEAKNAHLHAGWRFRVYYCSDCRGWHVTNGDKRGHGEGSRDARRDPKRRRRT